jgi:lipopolysaccharide heptosyltransferase I
MPSTVTLPPHVVEALRADGAGLRFLVVRLAALGDVVRTLPPVRLVRAAAPASRIVWVVDDRWADVLSGHPDVNAVLAFPRSDWSRRLGPRDLVRAIRASARWAMALRRERADVVLDFHGNLRSGLAATLSGAAVRLGYSGHQQKEGNRLFSTHRTPAGPRRVGRMERNLSLIRLLGIEVDVLPDGGLPRSPSASAAAHHMTTAAFGPGPYAVLSPGASRGQAYKKPPAQLLATAAAALGRSGVRTLVVWGPGEEPDARAVAARSGGAAVVAPSTTLAELVELLREARVFVGGDTGPLHMACAVGCPVLALYGPTDPVVNAPWGVPSVSVAPPGRTYTGIKRLDRSAGGFAGLEPAQVESAVDRLLLEAMPPVRRGC